MDRPDMGMTAVADGEGEDAYGSDVLNDAGRESAFEGATGCEERG